MIETKRILFIGLIALLGLCDIALGDNGNVKTIKIPNNVVLTNKSAKFFITTEDEIIVNAETHKSYSLVFEKDLGSPEWSDSCDAGKHCLRWIKDHIVQAEVIIIDPYHVPTYNPQARWTFSVNGPPHTYVFDYKGYHLYGGPVNGIFPSDKNPLQEAPCVVNENKPNETVVGSIAERAWYMTSGHGMRINEESPLFITQNETTLLLNVENRLPYPIDPPTVSSTLTLCLMQDVKSAWECIHVNYHKAEPREQVIPNPTLTTEVSFGENITQENVMVLALEAITNNITTGVIEIDEGWETCYGNQIVDGKKFPDFKKLVSDLKKMNQIVTLWVHPFINVNCPEHDQLKQNLVSYINGTPVEVNWRKGRAGIFNFMNTAAVNTYVYRLQGLMNLFGVAGFKFDAGEVSFIEELNREIGIAVPNAFTQSYIAVAARYGPTTSVQVGACTMYQNLRLRLPNRNHAWEAENNGLQSIVPSVLQMTVLGYGAVIPDIVGGHIDSTTQVDKELLIRWIQLSTFMPSLTLSYLPTNLDIETMTIFRKYIDLYRTYSSYMLGLIFDDPPILVPMWYVDKDSPVAQTINDQYLLGNILVAPVVEKGATQRDIYFPTGFWEDPETKVVYTGPAVDRKSVV